MTVQTLQSSTRNSHLPNLFALYSLTRWLRRDLQTIFRWHHQITDRFIRFPPLTKLTFHPPSVDYVVVHWRGQRSTFSTRTLCAHHTVSRTNLSTHQLLTHTPVAHPLRPDQELRRHPAGDYKLQVMITPGGSGSQSLGGSGRVMQDSDRRKAYMMANPLSPPTLLPLAHNA